VPAMSRVERAAEEADPAWAAAREAGRQRQETRYARRSVVQGRTWPVPRTRYL
jgi:hypothetical protein